MAVKRYDLPSVESKVFEAESQPEVLRAVADSIEANSWSVLGLACFTTDEDKEQVTVFYEAPVCEKPPAATQDVEIRGL